MSALFLYTLIWPLYIKVILMKILIDNGHGVETKGKQSPDGQFKEYAYARKVADEVYRILNEEGYDAHLITPEENDVPLSERVRRVNDCGKDSFLVSIHVDAHGNGEEWTSAHGWSAFVYTNSSAKSKELAGELHDVAKNKGLHIRYYLPNQRYWEANYYILKHTKCPAVLTENLFQTNKEDVAYLESDKGFKTIVDIHVQGIKNYIGRVSKESVE